MEYEYRLLSSSREAEIDYLVEELEKDLQEQQLATSKWKVSISRMNAFER